MGPHKDGAPFFSMVQDQFGNFVGQRLMDNVSPATREQLLQTLRPKYGELARTTYGKHFLNAISKYDPSVPQTGGSGGSYGSRGGNRRR